MSSMTKRAKDKVPLYVEVPPDVKAAMEGLAEKHVRSVAGEVTIALKEYISRHQEELGRGQSKGK